LLGVAMTARDPRRKTAAPRLARPASHGLAEPAPLLPSPSPPMSLLTGRGGGARGIPAPSLPTPGKPRASPGLQEGCENPGDQGRVLWERTAGQSPA
jgi:hypothetical protein